MKRMIVFLTLIIAAAMLPVMLFAQRKESLAIFAFTGGNASDGETMLRIGVTRS